MNRKRYSACVLLVLCNVAAAQQRTADIPYVENGHERQVLDIYTPEASSDKSLPVMFWIHGGGWQQGDKSDVALKPKVMTEPRGFVFVSTNYRLLPDVEMDVLIRDVAKSFGWVHRNIAKHGGDPKRIFVGGHSAGAQLAALICIDDRYLKEEGVAFDVLKGCVPVDGDTYDIPKIISTAEHRQTLYGGKMFTRGHRQKFGNDPEKHVDFSAVTHVARNKGIPPFLILYFPGNPDTRAQAERLEAVLKESDIPVTTYGKRDSNHSRLNNDLGQPEDPATQELYKFLDPLAAGLAFADDGYSEKPGTEGNGDFVIGPDYQIDADLTDKGNPKGQAFEFSMPLADSRIYRGDDSTLDPRKPVRSERKIFVYIPAAYQDGTSAPILVMHDGPSRLNLVRNALDNLTISEDPNRKLPAFIAIAVQNGGDDSYGSQRGLEYDTMSDRLARFVNDEVLPAVLTNADIKAAYPGIAFTKNPWGRAVMGCSSGGAAALSMGWFRPDLFRRLITYSGTFVDQQDDDAAEEKVYPLGAWEYHSSMKLIENTEKKPLRIFTHVSEYDNRANDPESTYHNWVMANERTAAALKAKGYDYRYVFSKATRHCDGKVFEQTLADTLVWMWRGYHAED